MERLRVKSLTPPQAEDLRAFMRACKDARLLKRAQIVWLSHLGKSVNENADLLDISPETVREWLRRYEERGINGLREGKNLVLDNYAIHRSRRVREFVEGEEGRRVALVFLPTYSPNLNIVEPFWKFVKAGAASNRFHGSVERLREAVNRFFRGCERGKIPAFRFPTGIWGDFFGLLGLVDG